MIEQLKKGINGRAQMIAQEIEIVKADLQQKARNGDWHGVADCATDIREKGGELNGLGKVLQMVQQIEAEEEKTQEADSDDG